jgi:hypothetical protein
MSTVVLAGRWLPPAVRAAPDDVDHPARLLDDLLVAVDRQRQLLAQDIDQVWQDLFIESCADWAVPYLGRLVGLPPDVSRLEVAYTIALRRRKGTPAAFEDFAEVLTGWTARAVEGWQTTLWVQRLGHPPPPRTATVNFADLAHQRIGTPFERARRSVSPGGRWSPRSATAVVWPWRVVTLWDVEACPLPASGPTRFALHPLGLEAPPYLRPEPLRLTSDADGTWSVPPRTGAETDAPVRATYQVLQALAAPGSADIVYGGTWQLADSHPLAPAPGAATPPLVAFTVGGSAIAWDKLRFGNLPEGGPAPFPPAPDEAIVDVARGHVELGAALAAEGVLRATWHRPVPGSLGALGSACVADPSARVTVTVNPAVTPGPRVVATIAEAFTAGEALSVGMSLSAADSLPGRPDVEIRLDTSDRLDSGPAQAFTPTLPRWRIVAPGLSTPTLLGPLNLDLVGACLNLEGFWLEGDLRLGPHLEGVTLSRVTMNPPAAATIIADPEAWGLDLAADHCLLGAIRADLAAGPLTLSDCVVDGRGAGLRVCGGDRRGALRDSVAGGMRLGPQIRADSVTFVGPVRAEAIDAQDCVFVDGVEVVQQQEGCLRFCFHGPALSLPPSLPPVYRCGPFAAPTFASVGFESAGYYTVALEPDHPLLSAASDCGEVGGYHHDRRGLRIERLRRRIDEFVPLGLRGLVALAPWEE